jgi:hypothetical protein
MLQSVLHPNCIPNYIRAKEEEKLKNMFAWRFKLFREKVTGENEIEIRS